MSPAVISNLVVRTFEVVFGSTTRVITFLLTAALSQGVDNTGEIAVELGTLNGCPSTVTEFERTRMTRSWYRLRELFHPLQAQKWCFDL